MLLDSRYLISIHLQRKYCNRKRIRELTLTHTRTLSRKLNFSYLQIFNLFFYLIINKEERKLISY